MTSRRLHFSKYHGLGNDFIMVDNTGGNVTLSTAQRHRVCERRYGVGADGIIVLRSSSNHAFVLDYYNADGNIGSLCGNGSRCALAFARKVGLLKKDEVTFHAYDGVHYGRYMAEEQLFAVGMKDKLFDDISKIDDDNYFVDTGSPHHVRFVQSLSEYDVKKEGKLLRNGKYGTAGANINFVEVKPSGTIFVRTYERGVEDETEACGTGAVAVALVTAIRRMTVGEGHGVSSCDINMGRGKLKILYTISGDAFTNVQLIGSAVHVFDGDYLLADEI